MPGVGDLPRASVPAEVLRFLTDFASWPLNIQLGTLAASPAQLPGVYRCSSWTSPAGAPASAHSGRPVAELFNAAAGRKFEPNVHRSDGSRPSGPWSEGATRASRAGGSVPQAWPGKARRRGVCIPAPLRSVSRCDTCVYIYALWRLSPFRVRRSVRSWTVHGLPPVALQAPRQLHAEGSVPALRPPRFRFAYSCRAGRRSARCAGLVRCRWWE